MDLPDTTSWFTVEEGLPRPDWIAVCDWMEGHVAAADRDAAWQQVSRLWLQRLRDALGSGYAVATSDNFLLLSARNEDEQRRTLKALELLLAGVLQVLGDLGSDEGYGKHVALLFADPNNFLRYIGYYYPIEGHFAQPGGAFIDDTYRHLALWSSDVDALRPTVAHELTHSCLVDLPLPVWLDEAVAMEVQGALTGAASPDLDRERVAEHRTFWTAETIASFWTGDSFGAPDPASSLSYQLARLLLYKIRNEHRPTPRAFCEFVRQATWTDAGDQSARQNLGVGLNDLVAGFLGPGEWGPLRTRG